MKSFKGNAVWMFGLLFLVLSTVMLEGQELTGNLKGTVTDQDGYALPGVTVTIESPQLLGGPKATNTDESGRYHYMALSPGLYDITVELDGFQTQAKKEQVINVGKLSTIDFKLALEAMQEQIVVTGDTPVVDREETGVQHNVTQELLSDVPIARSYQSIIAMLPGVKGGANPNVNGAADYNNQFLIDGVDTTDPVTGTFGTNFTFDAVQDIQYSTAGYLPEYGQVLGAVTNIVTKSGGNRLSGSAIFNTFQPSFRAEHNDEVKQERTTQRTDYEFSSTVGGPVKKDRVWYYGVFNFNDIADGQDALSYDRTFRTYYWLGKVSAQLGTNQRAVFQAFGDPFYENNENFDTSWSEEANPKRKQGGQKVSGNWVWALAPSAFLETKVYYNEQILNIESKNGKTPGIYDHDAYLRSTTTNEPYYLGNWGRQNSSTYATWTSLYERPRTQYDVDYSHLLEALGDHEFKTGMEMEFSASRETSEGEWIQLSSGWTQDGTLLAWQHRLGETGLTQADWDGTRNYSKFVHPYAQEESTRKRVSFYAQDKWSPTDKLTINYGIRVDDTNGENDVKTDITNFTTFSPRAGFTYDLKGNGKTLLRASAGRYYEHALLMFPSSFNETSEPTYRYMYNWRTRDYDLLRSIAGGPDGFTLFNQLPLKSPYMNEFTFGAEREVIPNFSVGVNFIHRRTTDILEDLETNIVWQEIEEEVHWSNGVTEMLPNWAVAGFNNGIPQTVFALTNPSEAKRSYDGVELNFNKRFSDKWQLLGSYTWSKAKGPMDGTFTIYGDGPNFNYNRTSESFLSHDRTHDFSISGSYHMPFGIVLGARTWFQSGTPFSLLYRDLLWGSFYMHRVLQGGEAPFAFDVMDRNGTVRKHYAAGDSLREPWEKQVDLRIEKSFRLPSGEFDVYVDIFNLMNWSYLTDFSKESETLGQNPTFKNPRSMRMFARYTF